MQCLQIIRIGKCDLRPYSFPITQGTQFYIFLVDALLSLLILTTSIYLSSLNGLWLRHISINLNLKFLFYHASQSGNYVNKFITYLSFLNYNLILKCQGNTSNEPSLLGTLLTSACRKSWRSMSILINPWIRHRKEDLWRTMRWIGWMIARDHSRNLRGKVVIMKAKHKIRQNIEGKRSRINFLIPSFSRKIMRFKENLRR